MRSRKLAPYRAKRDFSKTAEPSGDRPAASTGHAYLIQKHAARRLHYDFRLEIDGTLKSWAVTRGPSLNPADKRLAVHVEDHPLAYGDFEGTIPQGEYGGGTVMLWDQGTWEPIGDAERGLKKGRLDFELHGKRLKGRWHLVRMAGNRRGEAKRENWLLIKGKGCLCGGRWRRGIEALSEQCCFAAKHECDCQGQTAVDIEEERAATKVEAKAAVKRAFRYDNCSASGLRCPRTCDAGERAS
jgi:DNA ligase D-like protein (predicted 3'-phosphoesterase)